jgi:hypothetical protein
VVASPRGQERTEDSVSGPTYSFAYHRESANAAFPGIGTQELVLSLLAGIAPEPEWSGCLVFEGDSPLEPGTVCVATSGPGADALQLRLVEAFERTGITVVAVYEGGPAPRLLLARVTGGVWDSPVA